MDEMSARGLDYSTLLGSTRVDFEMLGISCETPVVLAGIVGARGSRSRVELEDEEHFIQYQMQISLSERVKTLRNRSSVDDTEKQRALDRSESVLVRTYRNKIKSHFFARKDIYLPPDTDTHACLSVCLSVCPLSASRAKIPSVCLALVARRIARRALLGGRLEMCKARF